MRGAWSVAAMLAGAACGGQGAETGKCEKDPGLCADAALGDRCMIDPAKCVDATVDAPHVYDETPPQFTVTPVDLTGTYDATSHRLGTLACDWSDATYGFCFDAFGISPMIPGHMTIENPTFDYVVVPDTPIRAASPGRVTSVVPKQDEVGQYTVFVEPVPNSAYSVEYDHVTSPVAVGTMLAAGDIVGSAGGCCDGAHALVELGVHYHMTETDGTSTNKCPATYGDAAFIERHDAAEAAQTSAFPSSDHNATTVCVVDHTP